MEQGGSSTTVEYRFEVKNLDASRSVSDVVAEIARVSPELAETLSTAGCRITSVRVEREKTIPLDPATVTILVVVGVLIDLTIKPFLEGFFKKLGERMAEELLDDVDNAGIAVVASPEQTTVAPGAPPPPETTGS